MYNNRDQGLDHLSEIQLSFYIMNLLKLFSDLQNFNCEKVL